MTVRRKIPADIRLAVLTEAGFQCGNPGCSTVATHDLHHLDQISDGGGDTLANMLPLCPTCHARHHRGDIPAAALRIWKGIVQAKSSPYDREALELLRFVQTIGTALVSGDGLLRFARLLTRNLVSAERGYSDGPVTTVPSSEPPTPWYRVRLTQRGEQLLEAWLAGDPALLAEFVTPGGAE